MTTKTKVIAICGEAGVGKDTAARYMAEYSDWNLIVSYTNRPMREGEQQGVEHIFTDKIPEEGSRVCHTLYPPPGPGVQSYHYWTEPHQFMNGRINIYVIDEVGLRQLELQSDKFEVVSILMTRDIQARINSGVTEERIARDKDRQPLPTFHFDHIIKNDKSLKALRYKLDDLIYLLSN